MKYYDIVIDIPLYTSFIYSSDVPLVRGQRVVVPFRGRAVVGIVWQENQQPNIDPQKIKNITHVFNEPLLLGEKWCELIEFCSRYYHYPIGQTAFVALAKGLRITKEVSLKEPDQYVTLTTEGKQQTSPPSAHKQKKAVWQALKEGVCSINELKSNHPQVKKYLEDWVKKGWLDSVAKPDFYRQTQFILNDEQKYACAQILGQQNQFAPFLLFGITGSGKTEVYFSCIESALKQGKQVLFLLPEINLTPQLLDRVYQRFGGNNHIILHSQIADGARTQGFISAALGEKQLIIGTRLSVFTPIQNLGLIIVDEEHDASFKQEEELRYHARDIALWRANQVGCPIVLGSATPSLDTYYKAQQGKYYLLQLTERANTSAILPEINIEDVRRQKLDNGFSDKAIKLLQDNFEQGNLSLVYLNRRGFAPALVCTSCGHSFGCPHCSAKMVLHKAEPALRCHHCNFTQNTPNTCPECGNQDLTALGQGTQRIEDVLAQMLPKAKIARVDRDSIARKNDWLELYQKIKNKEINVLVGTQMLAKGHDFADLSLVIILNADGSLYSPDFRAEERLFSELMQVSGRAGRAEKKGLVLLQTQLPDQPLFQALKNHDYAAFAQIELDKRAIFGFSPFSYSIVLRAEALTVGEAMHFLNQVKNNLTLLPNVSLLGPAPAFMVRLAKRERAQLFLESTDRKALHQTVQLMTNILLSVSKKHKQLRWSIDVDPMYV